ncbi:MAG: 16S rRNA (cytosine(1402)-N(4))-methyltransferase [Candidatus Portnoybacteria bacterium CG_4_8_14_3_um_filter_44_10]|uniref:Ribosomal RNA small subunit methyltransferase H n=4 Tax=Candidatus Portnoyibacteriota TaxID=1817913 RepID=A0A2H0KR17_9BACT|nr:MAG: 16S rRNA (cytosine(1402)-N(4))-methyltransferase [Parcubacteria group bacterium CG2_30_44_18]PIQ74592.1 MAG: 16S rRNA (cytosine(1402)-N(4))-methyltransferase [Candidatus Portnoybacteria bacterium CG11_big_fil_rev_8_21_14_0_20_44_10]PIS16844.1 MAG: 16S rRNA (cytosine(1402)-N(4))-methyltransferase [Candidatus Portnoybacteria bacterium CG09_land_8_20_14_0_10_44_13]PIW75721.1 MAG: 16S rRNA (cytosine(1402)-N(4))-methyltransferase [Candidatus Portnoybacteria bacterium CG_4_8_14_3_um_filter_44_
MINMHVSVLLKEVIEYLNPRPGENFIDCTINGGGHSLEIFKQIGPNGKILGIDWDSGVLEKLESKLDNKTKKSFILICDNYRNLKNIVGNNNFSPVHGILFDLGMSSWQLGASGRGFSFQKDEPLDMRYSENQTLTAKEIINQWPEEELIKIFGEYGEERRARAIAREIVFRRKRGVVESTTDLVEIVRGAIPARQRFGRIHFATRIFQALRLATNEELENLSKGLEAATDVLAAGGRMAVISFHSLEDRIVKNFLREKAREKKLEILTKKPIVPDWREAQENPRSRSAKLRAAIKL